MFSVEEECWGLLSAVCLSLWDSKLSGLNRESLHVSPGLHTSMTESWVETFSNTDEPSSSLKLGAPGAGVADEDPGCSLSCCTILCVVTVLSCFRTAGGSTSWVSVYPWHRSEVVIIRHPTSVRMSWLGRLCTGSYTLTLDGVYHMTSIHWRHKRVWVICLWSRVVDVARDWKWWRYVHIRHGDCHMRMSLVGSRYLRHLVTKSIGRGCTSVRIL